jgi:hypothetical protein
MREPEEMFFDLSSWQWMGRVQIGPDPSDRWIVRQLEDGQWVTMRRATEADNLAIANAAPWPDAFNAIGKVAADA